ncbi:MAG TPA: hypothetical protein VLA19_19670 [Herpetosiphonaceae bacterium]|nr:hypothetical protein [Herpetosiphonaceae bacterium]
MSSPSSGSPAEQGACREDESVYRLAKRSGHIDRDNKDLPFTPAAFLLDPGEEGLSVFPTGTCSLRYAIQNILRDPHGVDALGVGDIRSVVVEGLTLDVVRREDPNHPGKHAEIVGLPHVDDDEVRANRAAELLAKQSHRVWRRREPIPEEDD